MTAKRAKDILVAFCGVALLYIVLGALAALVFPSAAALGSSCAPDHLLHTLTQCEVPPLNAVWRYTMAMPRFLLLWPVLAVALVQTFGQNFGSYETEIVVLQTIAVLGLVALAAMTWLGLRFWQKRAPFVMWLLLIVIVAHSAVVFVGLTLEQIQFVPLKLGDW